MKWKDVTAYVDGSSVGNVGAWCVILVKPGTRTVLEVCCNSVLHSTDNVEMELKSIEMALRRTESDILIATDRKDIVEAINGRSHFNNPLYRLYVLTIKELSHERKVEYAIVKSRRLSVMHNRADTTARRVARKAFLAAGGLMESLQ